MCPAQAYARDCTRWSRALSTGLERCHQLHSEHVGFTYVVEEIVLCDHWIDAFVEMNYLIQDGSFVKGTIVRLKQYQQQEVKGKKYASLNASKTPHY